MTLAPPDGMGLLGPEAAQYQGSTVPTLSPEQLILLQLQTQRRQEAFVQWAEGEFTRMKNARRLYERQWYINLAFYYGKQNIAVVNNSNLNLGFGLVVPKVPSWRVRSVTNKIRTIVRTECSKLTSQRPMPTVIPKTTEDEDASAARVAEQILNTQFKDAEFLMTIKSFVWWGSVTGNAYLKQYWHPGEIDGQGQMGKMCIDRVSPFHVFVPDIMEEELYKQPYLFHISAKSPQWVEQNFGFRAEPDINAASDIISPAFVNLTGGQNAVKTDAVMVKEVWIKPGGHRDYPQGGVVQIINNRVVNEAMSLREASVHGEFPFYKYHGIPTGQYYTDSVCVDAIPLQKEYNRTRSQIIEAKNITAKPKLLYPKGSIDPRKITSEPGQGIPYVPGFEKPTPLQLPVLPSYVHEELNIIQGDLDDISGQHEITRGNTPAQVTAATAISYLQEQDDSKLSYQFAGIEYVTAKLGNHYLQIASAKWDQGRLIRTVGNDNMIEVVLWQQNMLSGNTDVVVEAGSSLPVSKAARQALVMDLLKLGLIPPEQGIEMLSIGNMEKIYEDYLVDVRQVNRENLKMSKIPPEMAAQALRPTPALDENGQPMVNPNGTPVLTQPQPMIAPNSYDNHQAHLMLHNKFRKTQQFEILPDEVKQQFELHCMGHQYAMMMNSVSVTEGGAVGPEVGPDGQAPEEEPVEGEEYAQQ